MECEYAKQKDNSRTICECTLKGDFCGFVYFCHDERRVKNTSRYVTCVRRTKALKKKEEGEQ